MCDLSRRAESSHWLFLQLKTRDRRSCICTAGPNIVGSAFGYRFYGGALAVAAQTGVLVPDYRLAPEHPFPAALEDGLRAYRWLIGRGMPPEEVVLAGDSSGAGLVMSLLLTLKQEQAEMPGAAMLFCPWLDLGQRLPVDSHPSLRLRETPFGWKRTPFNCSGRFFPKPPTRSTSQADISTRCSPRRRNLDRNGPQRRAERAESGPGWSRRCALLPT
jgi:acetyl esterase/lipase